jgi:DNA-binding response OmpR family regulator
MAATAKRVIPMGVQNLNQVSQVTTVSRGSFQRLNKSDVEEMLRSPQLVPFIVLVQVASEELRAVTNEISGKTGVGASGRKLLGLLDKAVKPNKQSDPSVETSFGEVSINFPEMTVLRGEMQVSMTTLEFKTLKYLVENPRRVISRDELLNKVWGYENYPCTRTVDNHILKLRHKLEVVPAKPRHFHTVYGTGYKFLP